MTLSTIARRTCHLPLMLSLAYAAPLHADVVASFDAAIASGLPRRIVIPGQAMLGRGDVGGSELAIVEALDIEVVFTDGLAARTYLGTLQGESAVITRSGDHLDVTVPHGDGIAITGFEAGSDTSHHLDEHHTVAQSGTNDHATSASAPRRSKRDLSFLDPNDPRPVLTLWMFLHDDTMGMSRQHIHAGYVGWWLADLRRFLRTHRLRTFYIDRRAGITDLVYGDKEATMERWTRAAYIYAADAKLPYAPGRNEYKFMLLVKDLVAPSTAGLAWHGGDQAIASLSGSWSIVAHEFGHTLTATHADAAIWWSYVWPCDTNVYPTDYRVVSNCYRYTATNERHITDYLSRRSDEPEPTDPPRKALTMVE